MIQWIILIIFAEIICFNSSEVLEQIGNVVANGTFSWNGRNYSNKIDSGCKYQSRWKFRCMQRSFQTYKIYWKFACWAKSVWSLHSFRSTAFTFFCKIPSFLCKIPPVIYHSLPSISSPSTSIPSIPSRIPCIYHRRRHVSSGNLRL